MEDTTYKICIQYLSFIDPERGGFGEIFPEVMIFPEGFSPSKISSLKEISSLRNHRLPITKMFIQNIKACQSFIKIFYAFFGCLQISEDLEGLNSKFC